jgi:hypothetical protein
MRFFFALDKQLTLAVLGEYAGNRRSLIVRIVAGMHTDAEAMLTGGDVQGIRLVTFNILKDDHALLHDSTHDLVISKFVVDPDDHFSLLETMFYPKSEGAGWPFESFCPYRERRGCA